MDYKNKNILVVGAARSGLSAAKLLKRLGARVTIADSKPRDKLRDAAVEMESLGVQLCLGKNAGYDVLKGQSLVVSSPGVPADIETLEIARREGIPIIGEMELAFTLCTCPVAAITGTNGKTTTVSLAGEIISRHIADTRTVGNIGSPFTDSVLSLRESSFAVIEASSFQLEELRVFRPKISVILNISPDHLDRHKTMQKYIEAKTNIYKYSGEDCFVLLNGDDPVLKSLKVGTGARVLYFSVSDEVAEGAYLKNGVLTIRYSGVEYGLLDKSELRIPGLHNVENSLAASLTAFCAEVPPDTIAEALRRFRGVPHRLELVREINGVKYYNDSKGTNPDASIKALEALDGKIVLIAGGYDKNAGFAELSALFNKKLSHLIILGETKEKIIEACKKAGFLKYTAVDSYESAVSLAARVAVYGDNVLLSPACASWDMFKSFEERGDYFKTLVNAL